MCIFSKPKTPDAPTITQAPAPAPPPVITPSEISPQTQEDSRRKRLERLRSGLASTIKTSARGIFGSGAELSSPAAGKTKLGQ